MQNLRTIQVFTNYYENYNFDGPIPYYKIKGTHVFEIKVDFDDLMYREEELTAAINDMIAKDTNPSNSPMACKYIITNIDLKNDVTELPTLTPEDLTKYKPTRSNKINPALCSRAARESIREIKNYREICDFTDVEDMRHDVFTW
tara:strand:+ start:50 stop:484 length:435 start_codon:yes stop_codon:yes gene_type:complete